MSMVGKQVGELTILSLFSIIDNTYNVKCSCGFEYVAKPQQLRAKKCKLCKAGNTFVPHIPIGKVFGRCRVKGLSKNLYYPQCANPAKPGDDYYKVLCACGNDEDVLGSALVLGNLTQCTDCSEGIRLPLVDYVSGEFDLAFYDYKHPEKTGPLFPEWQAWDDLLSSHHDDVCIYWVHSFPRFVVDMGERPDPWCNRVNILEGNVPIDAASCRWASMRNPVDVLQEQLNDAVNSICFA